MDQNPNTKKNHTIKIVLVSLGVLVALFVLARYVVFKNEFEEFGDGLERIEQWQTEYKRNNPEASKEEMDAAFRAGIEDLDKWKLDYMAANPGATEEDAEAEFNRLWSK